MKQRAWSSVVLTLLALAIVYGVGTAFVSVELERWVERTLTPHLVASPSVTAMSREVYAGLDRFMAAKHVRAIGFACIALVLLLASVGLVAEKKGLAFLGSLGFILTIYACFVLNMSFLAGLQVLSALWAPFWGNLVRLGDIAFLPYMILVYPFSLVGVDSRQPLAGTLGCAGLLISVLGVLAWFHARVRKVGTADFWIYRFTRHPQYLGWIIWSCALMLRVSLRHDTVLQEANPGASLPWVISTLIIVCVALSEESACAGNRVRNTSITAAGRRFWCPCPVSCRACSRPHLDWSWEKGGPKQTGTWSGPLSSTWLWPPCCRCPLSCWTGLPVVAG